MSKGCCLALLTLCAERSRTAQGAWLGHHRPPLICTLQDKTRLDITRLQRLADGFGSFTVAGTQAQPAAVAGQPKVVLHDSAREALKVVFSRDGSYVQVRPAARLLKSCADRVWCLAARNKGTVQLVSRLSTPDCVACSLWVVYFICSNPLSATCAEALKLCFQC